MARKNPLATGVRTDDRHASRPVRPAGVRRTPLPADYAELLTDLKTRIRIAQVKAALSVNREMLQLYWSIGGAIVERQQGERWGSKVIDSLARDIQAEFPGLTGFSRGNIFRMRNFFLAYTDVSQSVAQPARQRGKAMVAQAARQLPHAVAEIPWGHNIVLLERIKDPAHRLWYAQQTLANGWSRAVLDHQIDLKLHERAGKALTNFTSTLPKPDSDLAHQLLKDPYNFDFLALGPAARERELESGLIDHIKDFLLELGVGFAFVGRQYAIEVGGEAFYLDLLFYHLKLRRYVVIDLKAQPFKPEFAGKMNFYLSAADDLLRNGDDQPSIGLILCKTRNNVIAEYALRDTTKPMGVATYGVRLPESLRGALPSPQEICDALKTDDQDSRETV